LECKKVGLIKSGLVEIEIGDFGPRPTSAEEAYLRLHLLSECFWVKTKELNLDGIFRYLPMWRGPPAGPVLPSKVEMLSVFTCKRASSSYVVWNR